ncbi:MAG: hypothetical protein EZS28_005017 [Streblomastix strix]|uniref:F-box domain-containing protein n=1 Tax=Streblomastix strix TaxID=222440 RepID=A0A5J4WWP2_9EUKA|nr:MAG: hypothetical protein EZS28_005017 [Streblomastix strix]
MINFNTLPDNILTRILVADNLLSYYRFSSVCKKWRDIIQAHWETFTFRDHINFDEIGLCGIVRSQQNTLRELDLTGCVNIREKALNMLLKVSGIHLTKLQVNGLNLTHNFARQISQHCASNLKHLELSCSPHCKDEDDFCKSFYLLGRDTKLQYFDISFDEEEEFDEDEEYNEDESGDVEGAIIAFLNGSGRIKMHIYEDNDEDEQYDNVTGQNRQCKVKIPIGNIDGGQLIEENDESKSIENTNQIYLNHFGIECEHFDFSDEGFSILIEHSLPAHSQTLRQLKLKSSEIELKEGWIKQIIQQLPHLNELDFNGCESLVDFSLNDLQYQQSECTQNEIEENAKDPQKSEDQQLKSQQFSQLQSLNLSNTGIVTSQVVEQIVIAFPLLVKLDLSYAGKKLDEAALQPITQLKKLEELNISGWSKLSSLSSLDESQSQLKILNMEFLSHFSQFSLHRPLHNLIELSLARTKLTITEGAVSDLKVICPSLKKLDLSNIKNIENGAFLQLSQLPLNSLEIDGVSVKLENIQMMFIEQDTEKEKQQIKESNDDHIQSTTLAQNISLLSLFGCEGVNNDILRVISQTLLNLEEIDIGECNDVDDQGITELYSLICYHRKINSQIDSTIQTSSEHITSQPQTDHFPFDLIPSKLHTLKMSSCRSVTDVGMRGLFHGLIDTDGNRINWRSMKCQCEQIGDEEEQRKKKSAKEKDDNIDNIAHCCCMPVSLKILDISLTEKISHQFLKILAHHPMPNFSVLEARCCEGFELVESIIQQPQHNSPEDQSGDGEKQKKSGLDEDMEAFLTGLENRSFKRNPQGEKHIIELLMKGIIINREMTD